MNKRKAFELLSENLEKYFQEGFQFHGLFLEEFKTLLKNASGNEKEIFSLLIKQFNFIKVLGKGVDQADGNEIIKYQEQDYYSIHLNGKNFNLRLLMTFDEDGNPVFLAAFYERAGKKSTDYTQWKNVLKQRFQEVSMRKDDEK